LRFGDLLGDRELLEQARADAQELVAADPGLKKPEHLLMRQAVFDRFGASLGLAEVG